MAKKKGTQKANDTNKENPPDQKAQLQTEGKTITDKSTMEDLSEKINNLKNLNNMLLKETIEKRQRVDSLNQAKEDLESQMARFSAEKSELVAQLDGESEKNVSLEIENGLFSAFVRTQMREMGLDFDKENGDREKEMRVLKSQLNELMCSLENERKKVIQTCRDRDVLKSNHEQEALKAHELKERLVEMEKKEGVCKGEILILKKEYESLLEEKNESGRHFEAVKEKKAFVERRLDDTVKEIDGLKAEMEGILRENKKIEVDKSGQRVKIDELNKEVERLNEVVLEFQKEEKVLRDKVLELQKSFGEAMEKEKEMTLKINNLMSEKTQKQNSIEKLIEQKEGISKRLEMAIVELNDKEGRIEKLLREKNETEEKKVSQETEIIELHKEIGALRDVVFTLKESNRDQEEKNNHFLDEVRDYKNALDRIMHQKDEAKKGFNEEKKNGMILQSKVVALEKKMQENVEDLTKIRNERETLIAENKKMHGHIELLAEENELMQKNLLEATQAADNFRSKMESVAFNSERALSMLKKTAAMVCQSKDDADAKEKVLINDEKLGDKTEMFTAELEAIQTAFRNKEKAVEDMKRQVEFLQNSEVEAHKKKSFWTVVSSATTIIAAASIAYAARIP
ncbi:centrosomal protein of 135 kDa-like [Mangifera indica]|uniref:centrosomal protein of 135 kDa-like n=1 Tax=Mangifera indica TaxID=29780 RepID=UPI001CFAEAF9|nr:centrosomal protein of 135 kDa-like [Mangifera indica]